MFKYRRYKSADVVLELGQRDIFGLPDKACVVSAEKDGEEQRGRCSWLRNARDKLAVVALDVLGCVPGVLAVSLRIWLRVSDLECGGQLTRRILVALC